jgi:hypothetical protein
LRRSKLCFRCFKTGHSGSNCPTRQNKSNSR